tara:strand:+ start:533 stop:1165 length:633 start_codon:yes stop_codon:yes gene_type:complete
MPQTEITCYGLEFFDEEGVACPHTHCVAYSQCKKICSTATGVLHERKVRIKADEIKDKKNKKAAKKKKEDAYDKKVKSILLPKQRKSGYTRPQKLEYVHEGSLRDEMMTIIFEFFKNTEYKVHTTKYVQSVSKNFVGPVKTKYLLKISTTRKKSILVYVREKVSQQLLDVGIQCRQVYTYESLCFPNYLKWVAQIKDLDSLDKFLGVLEV